MKSMKEDKMRNGRDKMKKHSTAGWNRLDLLRNDRGSSMLVVMAIVMVLFITAAAVIGVVVFQQTQQATAAGISRSTQLAEQGMEVYLGKMRQDPQYWLSSPKISGTSENGTWTAAANVASSTITAVGHDSVTGIFHVIQASVSAKTYSDYTILSNGDLDLGSTNSASDIQISGAVRSNSAVNLALGWSSPGLTVDAASGNSATTVDFTRAASRFPSLFTAASYRNSWAGAQPTWNSSLAFYRDPSNPQRNYWGNRNNLVSSDTTQNADAEIDRAGVGIDLTNGANSSTGLFYIRAVFPPPVPDATAANRTAMTRQQLLDFARLDPVWSLGSYGDMSPTDLFTKKTMTDAFTQAYLNPNGNNVVYVGGDYDVYVKGTYSRPMTIVSERNIYIIGSVTRSSSTPTATLGLIAKGNIYICGNMTASADTSATYSGSSASGYSGLSYTRGSTAKNTHGETLGSDVTIQAALMAVGGSIQMDPASVNSSSTTGPARRSGTLTISGSLAANDGVIGPNFVSTYNASLGGFAHTRINYDSNLTADPPTLFPQLGNGEIVVRTWYEFNTHSEPDLSFAVPSSTYFPPGSGAGGGSGGTWGNGSDGTSDTVPPTTVSNVEPLYTSSAIVTLYPSDNAGGSGVYALYCTVDGGPRYQSLDGGMVWTVADSNGTQVAASYPLAFGALVPNTAANHTFTYWAKDNAGNSEVPNTGSFRMIGPDTIAPTSSVFDNWYPSFDHIIPASYPNPSNPSYVIWGTFNPIFNSVDTSAGAGADEIWVVQDHNPATAIGFSQPNGDTLSIAPPTSGFVTRYFEYYGIDKAGNREAPRSFTITQHAPDLLPPTTYSDAQASYVGTATITLSGADDPEGMGLKDTWWQLDGGTMHQSVENPTVVVVAPDSNSSQHTLTFYSRDLANNQETPKSVYFSIAPVSTEDTVPPVTTSDATDSYYGPATINLSATDANGVAAVHWKLDSGDVQSGTQAHVPAPFTGSVSHVLYFWAEDFAGNVEDTKTVSFVVYPDRTAPVTTAENLPLYAGPATFQLIAVANDSQRIAHTYYSIDDGPSTESSVNPTWVTISSEGSHTISFHSTDLAGNVESTKTATLRIDTTAPVTSVDAVSNYVGQASIGMTATDTNGSGVKATYWRNEADGYVQTFRPILLGPGTWNIDYWSVDNAGNVENFKTFHCSVTDGDDTHAPMSYDDIQDYYTSMPAIINLYSWDVQSGVKMMYYTLDGISYQLGGTYSPPFSYQINVTGEGSHNISYYAVDNAGNVESSHIRSFVIDNIPPVTVCSANAGRTYWTNQTFTLSASDDANGSGIDKTFYSLDGAPKVAGNTIYVPASTNGNSQQHTIRYWSLDRAGNTELIKSVTFTMRPLDGIPPVTTSNAQPFYSGPATILLTAVDNFGGSGVASTYYKVDGGTAALGTFIGISAGGSHSIEFWSVDNAGNIEAHHTTSIFIDTAPPTTVSDTKPFYGGAASITLSTSDGVGGSGVGFTFYKIDGGPQQTGTVPSTNLSISGVGPHTLEFWSVDRVGNIETHHVDSFVIDLTPPTTTSNAVPTYNTTATVLLSAVDNIGGSGVASVHYSVDGGTSSVGSTITVAPPASGTTTHTIQFWSVDNVGNTETAKSYSFSIKIVANPFPITTSNALAAYTGTATIALTATDPGGPGIKATYYKLDSSAQTTGTALTVAPPATGVATHVLQFWSVDTAGVKEATNTISFTINIAPSTFTYAYTGGDQTFIVPAGVTSLSTTLLGAAGGASYWTGRGNGGQVVATIPVTPGSALTVRVGGIGSDTNWSIAPGGWPNGGGGHVYGGGGGGSSSILFGSADLVEAGAGGGGSLSGGGIGGGTQGSGVGGNQTGGSGASYNGGGGGGWNAGAAGSTYYGGIGGTSYCVAGTAVFTAGANGGAGSIVIRFTPAATTGPYGSMTVNNNAPFTNSSAVTVNSAVANGSSTLTSMCVDPGTGSFGSWVAYNAALPITMSTGDGVKTIRAQYRDASGNLLTLSDTILLDMLAPNTTSDAVPTYNGPAAINLSAFDGGSGILGTYYVLDSGSTQTGTAVSVPSGASGAVSTHTLQFFSTDNAGNVESTHTVNFKVYGQTTYTFTGADRTFVVPAGIKTLTIDLYGAAGGSYNYAGGYGGYVRDVVSVTPGQVLTLRIGGTGSTGSSGPGGWPNGGSSGHGGGGGGSTSVLYGGSIWAEAGAGGGGSCDDGNGGDGGYQGWLPGGNNAGGDGQGSGGGGGWNGGAGMESAHEADPGSGGSSYVAVGSGTLTPGANGGNGYINISYAVVSGPDGTMSINGGALSTKSTAATINSNVAEQGSTVTSMSIDPGTGVYGPWISYNPNAAITLPSGDGPKNINVRYTDAAGMILTLNGSILLDTVPPTTTSDAKTSYVNTATIVLTATDSIGGSGVNGTYYRVDGGTQSTGTVVTVEPPASGSAAHTVEFWSVDAAGNRESNRSVNISVQYADTTPPVTTSSFNPTSGAIYSAAQSVTLAATDAGTGVKTTYYRIDSGTYSAGTNFTVSSDGLHTISYYSVDNANNTETAHVSNQFRIDTVPPTTTSDAKASYFGTATVFLTATDSGSGVASTYYIVDSQPQSSGTTVTLAPPASGTATHTVNFWSKDNAGNTELVKSAVFTVSTADLIPPSTLSNFNPASGANYNSSRSVTLSATDNASGVKSTYYKIDSGSFATGVTFTVSGDGLHTFSYYSVDNSNNTETVHVSNQFRIDTVAPVTSSNVATASYNGTATINLTATDSGSGVASVCYQVDSAATQTVGGSSAAAIVAPPGSGSASHTIKYWSIDSAGNTETATSKTFSVSVLTDSIPPTTISDVSPIYYGSALIHLTATDNVGGSGVAGTFFKLDGGTQNTGNVVALAQNSAMTMSTRLSSDANTFGLWSMQSNPWTDSSGHGRTLTVSGTVTNQSSASVFGIGTNAAAGKLSLPTGAYITNQATGTIEVVASGGAGTVFGSESTPNGYWPITALTIDTNARTASWSWWNSNVSGSWQGVSGLGAANTGPMYVAVSWDKTGVRLYIDGTLVASKSTAYSYTNNPNICLEHISGTGNGGGWSNYFSGTIFDVRASTVARTPSEIAVNANPSASHSLSFWSTDNANNTETAKTASFVLIPVVTRQIFYYTGTDQTLTIPSGVTSISVSIFGASGGNAGGAGGRVDASVPVTPGQTLTVRIGGAGGDDNSPDGGCTTYGGGGGWPNGGDASGGWTGGGGGGSSSLWGTAEILEAGGGGGTSGTTGGAGGNPGWLPGGYQTGAANYGGGAGGGGWNAGGVNGGNGGGGGTSYIVSPAMGTMTPGVNNGHGYAMVTWNPPALGPNGTMLVNGGASYTNTPTVTVSSSISDGISTLSQMRIDPGSGTFGPWVAYATTTTATLSATDGVKTVRVQYNDLVGNTLTLSAQIRLDTIAPTTISDALASYIGTATINLTPTDGGSGVLGTYYIVDGGSKQTGTSIIVNPPSSGSTTHTVQFWSVDNATNIEATKTAVFTQTPPADTIPPVTTSDVKSSYNGTATIALTATDPGSGVKATYYKVDNGVQTTGTVITVLAPSSGVATHTISYWSVDNANNVETAHPATFTVSVRDTTAPITTSNFNPAAGAIYSSPQTATLSASDAGAGIRSTYYRVDAGAVTTYTVPFAIAGEGLHTFSYWSVDNIGNVETTNTSNQFRIDTVPPLTTCNAIASYTYVGGQTFTLSPADSNGSGISGTWWQLDSTSGAWSSGVSPAVSAPANSVQAHTLYWYSRDVAGNVEAYKSVSFTVAASTNPITVTQGTNGTITPGTTNVAYNGSQTFSITPSGGYAISSVTVDGTNKGAISSYTFSNVVAPHAITAAYVPTYLITVTQGANGTISPSSTNVASGGSQTFTIAPNSGYGIADVKVDGISQGAVSSYTFSNVASTHTITATYAQYAITVTQTTGGTISPSTLSVAAGASQTFNITPSNGYSIVSVVVDGVSQGTISSYTFTNVRATHTITATYTTLTYTINVTQSANGTITPGTTTVGYGGSQTFNIAPSSGYAIGSVTVDGVNQGTITSYAFIAITANHTITATFVPYYMITVTQGANGSITPSTIAVNRGGNQSFSIVPSIGYSTASVTVDGVNQGALGSYTFTNVTTGHTITAAFADVIAPVTTSNFNPVAGGIYGANQTVALSATDSGSGVKTTFYRVDGGTTTTYTAPFAVSGNGLHTFSYWSVDNANNTEAMHTSNQFRIDTVAPSTTSSFNPASGASYKTAQAVTLTPTDANGSGVAVTYYKVDGGSYISGTSFSITGDGSHSFSYYSVDNASNIEAVHTSNQFVIDTVAPLTSCNAVANQVYNGAQTFTLSVSESGSGIASTKWQLDGGAWNTGTSIPVPAPSSGWASHIINFYSTDNAGNVESTKSVSFKVTVYDTTAPTTSSDAISSYNGTATIALSAVDNVNGSGIAATYYKVDGGTQNSGTTIIVPAPGSGVTTHTVSFWSVDVAGNTESAKSATFTITVRDNTPPTTTSDAKAFYAAATTVTLSAVDNVGGSGVDKTYYILDGGTQKTGTAPSTAVAISGAGSHTLEFWSIDRAGNIETPHRSATLCIDGVAPTTSSNALASYNGTATISLTAVDNVGGSGVLSSYYTVDGGAVTTGSVISVGAPASGVATHTITFWSVDNVGNAELNHHSTTFSIQSLPEAMSFIVTPLPGSTVVIRNPNVSITAQDLAGQNIVSVAVSFDGASVAPTLTGLGTGSATASFSTSSLTDGPHTVSATFNVANGASATKTWTFTESADMVPPTTTSDVKSLYTGPATVLLSAVDNTNGSGVKATYYQIDGGSQTAGLVINIPAPAHDSAPHTIAFWSVDNAGNVEQKNSAAFTVAAATDITPPSTVSNARATYAVPGAITLTASDGDGWGVAHTYYRLDGGARFEGTVVRTGSAGDHTLEFWSVDLAGNIETPHKTVSYHVNGSDTEPPVTNSDAVANYVGQAIIKLTATDNSGVTPTTYFKVDGGAQTTGTVITVLPPLSSGVVHNIQFWSVDINGNTESAKSATFTVSANSVSMTFSDITPAGGSTVTSRNPAVSVMASALNPIVSASVLFDGVGQASNIVWTPGDLTKATVSFGTYGLANGTHTVAVTFVDGLGNYAVASWSFVVSAPSDSIAPTTTSSHVSALSTGPVSVQLYAVDDPGGTGVAYTYYRIDGGVQLSGSPPTTTVTVSTAGSHSVQFWSVDRAGNIESAHMVNFLIDMIAPTTRSDAQAAYTDTATVVLTPSDNGGGSGVAATYYIVDSGLPQLGTVVSIAAPRVGSAWHTVYFWSVDNAGNVEAQRSVTFNVWAPLDETPPTTTSNALATYTAPSTIMLTAVDDANGSGVAHTYYILDSGPQIEATVLGTGGQGAHTLRFWSVDLAGNVETAHSVSYTVTNADTTAPVSLSDALTSYVGTATINLSVTDNSGPGGVAHIYYRIDGGAQTEGTVVAIAPPAWGSPAAAHTLTFYSVDFSSNWETPKNVSFTVAPPADGTPPSTMSNALASYIGTASITLTPMDNAGGSGVVATYYRIDGGAQQSGTVVSIAPPAVGNISHGLQFWSVDAAGNIETAHNVTFSVAAGNSQLLGTLALLTGDSYHTANTYPGGGAPADASHPATSGFYPNFSIVVTYPDASKVTYVVNSLGVPTLNGVALPSIAVPYGAYHIDAYSNNWTNTSLSIDMVLDATTRTYTHTFWLDPGSS